MKTSYEKREETFDNEVEIETLSLIGRFNLKVDHKYYELTKDRQTAFLSEEAETSNPDMRGWAGGNLIVRQRHGLEDREGDREGVGHKVEPSMAQ